MSDRNQHESTDRRRESFLSKIEDKNEAFVLFYAKWCPFSQKFLPIYEKFKNSTSVECLSFTLDDDPDLCRAYSINYYPTVILFEGGKVKKRLDSKPGIGLDEKQLKVFSEKH